MKKVISIVGPTSVGKTLVGIEIAKQYNTDVISADSIQVFKQLNIGSAKVSVDEMGGVNHHLIDFLDPNDEFSVADFQKIVRDKIEAIKIPILVGGTGLYINSILNHFEFCDDKRNKSREKEYEHMSNEELHNELNKVDSLAASKIHCNNRRRVYRAFEYFLDNNKSITMNNKKNEPFYESLVIFLELDRYKLYDRINKRVDIMFEKGLLKEVKDLYDEGVNGQSITAIGYKELYSYFKGEINLDKAKELIKKNSRNFAKRQTTYFKNQFDSKFVKVDLNNFENTVDEVKKITKEFLNK